MQTRPDQSSLLEAVASFLLTEISPKLEADKALQFRVLIAANLAGVVANELRTQDTRLSTELTRLEALLGRPHAAASVAELEALNRELAGQLRAGAFTGPKLDAAIEHLFATAKETLEVTNPRFDVSDDPH
jgi:hypothetical protein